MPVIDPKKYDTITDLLLSQGFTVDETGQCFIRSSIFGDSVRIPFSTLSGHSVSSFLDKSKREGWIGFGDTHGLESPYAFHTWGGYHTGGSSTASLELTEDLPPTDPLDLWICTN